VPQPHSKLAIVARSTVETQIPTALPDALDMGEWDRLKSDFVRGENFDFLRHHGFAIETDALTDFVMESGIDRLRARDPLTAVRRMSEIIYEVLCL